AKRDPDAALAWARGTSLRENLIGVLVGIAATDAERAFDVLKTIPPSDRFQAVQMIVSESADDRSSDPGRIAELLLANGDDRTVDNTLGLVLRSWSNRSPPSAMAWVTSHSDRLGPLALKQAAMFLAFNDSTGGEQFLPQLPSEARTSWIQGLA